MKLKLIAKERATRPEVDHIESVTELDNWVYTNGESQQIQSVYYGKQ